MHAFGFNVPIKHVMSYIMAYKRCFVATENGVMGMAQGYKEYTAW